MRTWFADSFFFFALLDKNDRWHSRAVEVMDGLEAAILTTSWVLTELADGYAATRNRARFVRFVQALPSLPHVEILPPGVAIFDEGMALYSQRLDKEWSLTDCTSFVAMNQSAITEALTGDHHFEQAGFIALLK